MYIRETSSGMVKAVLILVAIVVVTTFFGALGLADSGLLNWHESKANAQQILVDAQIEADRAQMELPYMEERLALENESLRLQQQEANRMMVAENNRTIDFNAKVDIAKIVIGSFAAFALILVVAYGLMLLVGRLVGQAVPAPAPVAQTQPTRPQPPTHQAAPPDPWDDAAYRRMMKARARQQERTERTEELGQRENGRHAQPTVAPTSMAQNGHSQNGSQQNGHGFLERRS